MISNETEQVDADKNNWSCYFLQKTNKKFSKRCQEKVTTKALINRYSIFKGVKYFSEDRSRNYLLFQPLFKHFQTISGTYKILLGDLKVS